mmetsp:Transcript_19880/g.28575  ORF Transcript_19880/g.28575 Transcript_19880/m.28575 type:complete len:263 (+) Transcript_19880:559-1347(+)
MDQLLLLHLSSISKEVLANRVRLLKSQELMTPRNLHRWDLEEIVTGGCPKRNLKRIVKELIRKNQRAMVGILYKMIARVLRRRNQSYTTALEILRITKVEVMGLIKRPEEGMILEELSVSQGRTKEWIFRVRQQVVHMTVRDLLRKCQEEQLIIGSILRRNQGDTMSGAVPKTIQRQVKAGDSPTKNQGVEGHKDVAILVVLEEAEAGVVMSVHFHPLPTKQRFAATRRQQVVAVLRRQPSCLHLYHPSLLVVSRQFNALLI